ncbi:MAG: ABC transporter permease subunit [Alphaproteobacteria bacterium]|nr:ABC transporter permease subunit [Alphaproteobacteria bacterium]
MTLRGQLAIISIPVIAFMLMPVMVVLGIAFGESANFEFPPSSLSLRWFYSFMETAGFSDSLFYVSLPLGIASAAAATAIGTLAAIAAVRFRFVSNRLLELLFLTPLIYPQILMGVGLFLLYARLNITPSLLTLGGAHVLIGCPYVVRTVIAGLVGIDPKLEEAARNLGASPVKAFWLATFPLLRSSILSGAIFAFIVSFSDINLALFLSIVNTVTLPVQIMSQMRFVSDPTIAAAAALQIVVISALLVIVNRLIGLVRP